MGKELVKQYKKKKARIKNRLKDFREVWKATDGEIFAELCFCICTPQSKAVFCDKAVSSLAESGMLYKGNISQIRAGLKAVRFPNNKARFILEARKRFTAGNRLVVKKFINETDIKSTREWLVKNVKGLGFKEASHFLRNIGFGKDLAILDVHILRNMIRYRVIKEIPKTITKKTYYHLENKIMEFSRRVDIPMDELDILLWSNETGEIFK